MGARSERVDAGALQVFRDALETIVTERPIGETLDSIATAVAELAAFDFVVLFVSGSDGETLHARGAFNLPDGYADELVEIFAGPTNEPALLASPTSRAMHSRQVVVVGDTERDPTYVPWRGVSARYGFRSIMSVPLLVGGEAVGVLNGYSIVPRDYSAADVATVEILGGSAAIALRLSTLLETQNTTINALQESNDELAGQRLLLGRLHDIHVRLTRSVIDGDARTDLTHTMSELLGRRVAVLDVTGAVVDAEFSDVGAEPGIRVPIEISGVVRGFLWAAAGPPERAELDQRALEQGALVLAVREARDYIERETELRLQSDFVHDFVHQRDSADRLAARARHLGWAVESARVVKVSLDIGTDDCPSNLPRLAALVRILVQRLAGDIPGILSSQVGSEITMLVPEPDGARIRRLLAEALRATVQTASRPTVYYAGIGSESSAVVTAADSFDEAGQCLRVLRRLRRDNEVISIDELGLLRLFVDSPHPERIVEVGQGLLASLLEDNAGSRTLLDTLETFLDHDCSAQRTADAMFVHVNTVKYRLGQIRDRTGLDLRTPDGMVKATIARLALSLLGTQRSPGTDR